VRSGSIAIAAYQQGADKNRANSAVSGGVNA
jgi:hypothetical protein